MITQDQIFTFFETRGLRPRRSSDNILAACPFAKWTHSSGTDSNPSFALKVTEEGEILFHCFACHYDGNGWMFQKLWRDFYNEELNWMSMEDYFSTCVHPIDRENNRRNSGEPAKPVSDEYIKSLHGALHPYFNERGLTDLTAVKWGLTYDSSRNRVVLPVRVQSGDLVGWISRSLDEHPEKKYLNSKGFQRAKVLFGENMLTHGGDIVLVEGAFDAIKVWQSGIDAMAVLGTEMSYMQAAKVLNAAPFNAAVYIMMDPDQAGQKATGKIEKSLTNLGLTRVIPVYSHTKDPSELSSQEIETALQMAVEAREYQF